MRTGIDTDGGKYAVLAGDEQVDDGAVSTGVVACCEEVGFEFRTRRVVVRELGGRESAEALVVAGAAAEESDGLREIGNTVDEGERVIRPDEWDYDEWDRGGERLREAEGYRVKAAGAAEALSPTPPHPRTCLAVLAST